MGTVFIVAGGGTRSRIAPPAENGTESGSGNERFEVAGQGVNEIPARGRSRTREGTAHESQQSPSPARRNRRSEEGASAQRMPPPPVTPVTHPGTTSHVAQILRDTRDVEPELGHQILRVVLGEGAGSGPLDRPASAQPQ